MRPAFEVTATFSLTVPERLIVSESSSATTPIWSTSNPVVAPSVSTVAAPAATSDRFWSGWLTTKLPMSQMRLGKPSQSLLRPVGSTLLMGVVAGN